MESLLTEKQRDDLITYFRYFADHHAIKSCPLYARFAHVIADSDKLLDIAALSKSGQPQANLMLAAVHYLLAGPHRNHPLTEYYDTLGGSRSLNDGDPGSLFAGFIEDHDEDVISLISTKVTNTNEVGRCSTLLPAFMKVAAETKAPLHMIEIGPSCGLIMCWDQYRYAISDQQRGPSDARIALKIDARGMPPLLSATLPTVASRTGLDLYPVDINDPETLAWQLALIWPGATDRLSRISKAFNVAREMQPKIIAGDAVEMLPDVINRLPRDGAVCIHHSFVTYQIPPDRRNMLSDTLAELGRERPIFRVAMEWIDDGARGLKTGDNSLGLARYSGGSATYQHLAFCDPHGRWLEWDPKPPVDSDIL